MLLFLLMFLTIFAPKAFSQDAITDFTGEYAPGFYGQLYGPSGTNDAPQSIQVELDARSAAIKSSGAFTFASIGYSNVHQIWCSGEFGSCGAGDTVSEGPTTVMAKIEALPNRNQEMTLMNCAISGAATNDWALPGGS